MGTSNKALNQARFGKVADAYVTAEVFSDNTQLDRLIEIAAPQPTWSVLDIGAGGGHTALAFAPRVERVIATDITFPMLQAARSHAATVGESSIAFQMADAEQLPYAANTFDLVTCRYVVHHLPDAFAFVQEARRVLKREGQLLVFDHVAPTDERTAHYINAFESLRDPAHAKNHSEYEWRGMILDAGMTIGGVEMHPVRLALLDWATRQGCDEATIERLQILLLRAPDAVRDWLQPEMPGTRHASFLSHNILISGRKEMP